MAYGDILQDLREGLAVSASYDGRLMRGITNAARSLLRAYNFRDSLRRANTDLQPGMRDQEDGLRVVGRVLFSHAEPAQGFPHEAVMCIVECAKVAAIHRARVQTPSTGSAHRSLRHHRYRACDRSAQPLQCQQWHCRPPGLTARWRALDTARCGWCGLGSRLRLQQRKDRF